MKSFLFRPGPAIIITAAFIGPGSLTVCATAGVDFGYELLWAILLSCLITIFFQNTVAYISFRSKQGLIELFNNKLSNSIFKFFFVGWILITIFIGNSAFEAGNISGAYIGLKNLIDLSSFNISESIKFHTYIFIALIIISLIWKENNRLLKNILLIAVLLMSISFLFAAFLTSPNIQELIKGFLIPKWSPEKWGTIVALLGTTIVPYNLFLHAALVKKDLDNLQISYLRRDTIISVCMGGIISSAIVITASGANINQISSINDLGDSLKNLYGESSQVLVSIGIFAAGITSAITAPIAAGFVVEESFINYPKSKLLKKATTIFIVTIGLLFSVLDYNPIELIKSAQIANGLLLPGVALFICILCFPKKNDSRMIKIRFTGLLLLFIFFIILSLKFLI